MLAKSKVCESASDASESDRSCISDAWLLRLSAVLRAVVRYPSNAALLRLRLCSATPRIQSIPWMLACTVLSALCCTKSRLVGLLAIGGLLRLMSILSNGAQHALRPPTPGERDT